MNTAFRTYAGDDDMIVFEQAFPSTVATGATKVLDAAAKNMDKAGGDCRIVTGKYTLTGSSKGFTAYTPSSSGMVEHAGQYCGDGHNTHAPTAYEGGEDEADCAAKCTAMKCVCFDVASHSPGPGPVPHHGGLSAQTIFPSFARNSGPTDKLETFSYHGVFPGMHRSTFGTYTESHQGGAPLTIYDPADPTLPMLVFSPLNFPKAHHMASAPGFVGAGIKATVEKIPGGQSSHTLYKIKMACKQRLDPYAQGCDLS